MSGPRRIVCLTEETTETLYLLGEQDRIVGISAFTVRPPEAKQEKPVVSEFIRAKIDKIIALKPDLVLGYSDLQADICADLIRAGLEVYCFNQRSVSEILNSIQTLGALIAEPHKTDLLIQKLHRNIDSARQTAEALPAHPRVFFEEWPDPIITGIEWASQLIEIAGGIDCFANLGHQSLAKNRTITPEDVIQSKPDLYLASWCGKKFRPDVARARPGFAQADFTQDDRMVAIDSSIILQPGPAALTDGLQALQREIVRVAQVIAVL